MEEIEEFEKPGGIYLTKKDVKDFTLNIQDGYFMWKIVLDGDDTLYQIKYEIEKHITSKGNKSKRKVYFIRKDNNKLIFDDEVKKWFKSFRQSYSGGI